MSASEIYRKSRVLVAILLVMMLLPEYPASAAFPGALPGTQSSTTQKLPAQQLQGPTDRSEMEAFLDGVMAAHLEAHHIPGAALAVVKDGEIFLAKGYGYADLETRRMVQADRTLFHIGSVAKLFTGTAVMQLAEEGKLDLHADVNRYLDPGVQIPDTYPEPITLTHLLTHTAGFEERAIGLFSRDPDQIVPLRQVLAEDMPARVRPPGQLAAYSNHGVALAGYIVARASGTAWDQYVEDRIFRPLGMVHSTAHQPVPDNLAPDVSRGYRYSGGRYEAGGNEYVSAAPAGGIHATATDVASLMIAHLQEGRYQGSAILRPETVELMHQRQFTHDPRVNGMAYSFIEMDVNDQRIIGHGGDTFLFHSQLVLLPEHNLGLFVSYNALGGAQARNELLQAFLDRYFRMDETPVPTPAAEFRQRAERFTGSYGPTRVSQTTAARLGALLSVLSVGATPDGYLTLSLPGSEPRRLVELEPDIFQDLESGYSVAFEEDDRGRIAYAYLGESPVIAFVRQPWYESTLLHLSALAASLLIFFSAVVVIPIRALFKRGNGSGTAPRSRLPRLARWLAWGLSLLNLAALGVMVVSLADPLEIAFGIPPGLRVASNLALLAGLLAIGSLVLAIVAWWRRFWGLGWRIYFSAITLAALAFIWQLAYWKIVPL